jgi:hypothetical protein
MDAIILLELNFVQVPNDLNCQQVIYVQDVLSHGPHEHIAIIIGIGNFM